MRRQLLIPLTPITLPFQCRWSYQQNERKSDHCCHQFRDRARSKRRAGYVEYGQAYGFGSAINQENLGHTLPENVRLQIMRA